MDVKGTMYLDFDCVSKSYQVENAESAGLVDYVLDCDPELSSALYQALDSVYPKHAWSSPGDSMFRRLCGWVRRPEQFSELVEAPDAHETLSKLRQVRDRMAAAYASRAYERHFFQDAREALDIWTIRQFRVISFSGRHSKEHQNSIVREAIWNPLVLSLLRPMNMQELNVWLGGHLLQEQDRSLVVLHSSADGAWWRKQNVRVVSLDREWVETPYLERGYYFNIRLLTDLDPVKELAREYY